MNLDYAKLMRKREKILGADGKPMPIDLQTLRASTASARGSGAEGGDHHPLPGPPGQGPPHQAPPYDGQPPMHPPPHGSPYLLIPVSAQNPPKPGHICYQLHLLGDVIGLLGRCSLSAFPLCMHPLRVNKKRMQLRGSPSPSEAPLA